PPPERVTGPRVPRSVRDLAARLPLERKVAQLFVWGFEGQDLSAPVYQRLRELDLGGILLRSQNYLDPQRLSVLAGEPVAISQGAGHVPPWVFASQEGSEWNAFADLPPKGAPADYQTAADAAAAAAASAQNLRALGVTAVLGPVLDVGTDDGGALGPRAFSDDPEAVARFGRLVLREYERAGVLAAPKHFPGLGAASQDTEEGPASVGLSIDELEARDLFPFRAAIRAGIRALVVGHGLYATDDFVTPASLSPTVTRELLRGSLRFGGVAIADDLSAPAITAVDAVPDAAIDALRAGADMLVISGPQSDQEAAYLAVLNAVRKGQVKRRHVDDAVLRILLAKERLGLIDPAATSLPAPGAAAPPAGGQGVPQQQAP
ncbi:MAG TPA: glycoside hydrolase family 3 N-terminal domain-containing protein, partial [Thermoleophilaceae bacterium]|nr:glycoside hydrolase family 3 N-terminal domain-containing protein [Thermoleophilaceae bacterium]